jgi:hypothetical protein
MGQISIYLDDATEAEVRARAKAAGKSLSGYVSEALTVGAGAKNVGANGWPQWWLDIPPNPDFPTAEEIRRHDLPDRGPPDLGDF